uniref:Uncharacterized protein n=1 Tax=Arundo donax TaxID=35708 RepID=A0A0A9HE47_ARUDO
MEFHPPECLCENVSELVQRSDETGTDAPIIQAAPDEMIPQVDVLAAFMEHRILRQCQGRLAVHL